MKLEAGKLYSNVNDKCFRLRHIQYVLMLTGSFSKINLKSETYFFEISSPFDWKETPLILLPESIHISCNQNRNRNNNNNNNDKQEQGNFECDHHHHQKNSFFRYSHSTFFVLDVIGVLFDIIQGFFQFFSDF